MPIQSRSDFLQKSVGLQFFELPVKGSGRNSVFFRCAVWKLNLLLSASFHYHTQIKVTGPGGKCVVSFVQQK